MLFESFAEYGREVCHGVTMIVATLRRYSACFHYNECTRKLQCCGSGSSVPGRELAGVDVASTAAPELCHRPVAEQLSEMWLQGPLFIPFQDHL